MQYCYMKKKSFKTSIAGVFLLWGSLVAYADGLIVTQANGVEIAFPFSEHPIITYKDSSVKIVSSKNQLELNLTEVQSFKFNGSNSITDVKIDATNGIVNGLTPGTVIDVYLVDGSKITSIPADQNGSAVIPFEHLPKTLIIINTPGGSYKYLNN